MRNSVFSKKKQSIMKHTKNSKTRKDKNQTYKWII